MNKRLMNKRPKQLLNAIALAMMAIFFFSTGCSKTATKQADASEITVAAAANLTDVFAEIGKAFTDKTGVRVTFSFGATADLGKQIENGGPFDVFAAADVEHVDELVKKGSLVSDTRTVYTQGRLVLWKPPQSQATLTKVEDVKAPNVKYIAVAKPDVAPYGRATVEALKALNIWTDVEPRVVYAQNVAQTKQQAASGNGVDEAGRRPVHRSAVEALSTDQSGHGRRQGVGQAASRQAIRRFHSERRGAGYL